MPRYYAEANTFGKRAYNGYMTTNQTAQKALTLATTVANLINVEFKNFDLETTPTPSTTATVLHLSPIPQGDSRLTRDGEQVKLKSLYIKARVSQHASATDTVCRFAVVMDTEGQGAVPTAAEIYKSTVDIVSHTEIDNKSRFIVLWDKVFTLGDRISKYFEYYKKLNHECSWESTTGANPGKNNLYFVHMSTEATNTPTLYFKSRIRYLDN